MMGAIAGDIIRSVYEHNPIKTKDFFPLPVSSLCPLHRRQRADGGHRRRYPHRPFLSGYRPGMGAPLSASGLWWSVREWLSAGDPRPYHSWGNGAAMRVGPVGWAFTSEEEVLHQARLSAAITHDHPEGIKGAQATALAIYLARIRTDKATIRARVQADFGYELERTVDAIRPGHAFDV